jgi:hypothetical protein
MAPAAPHRDEDRRTQPAKTGPRFSMLGEKHEMIIFSLRQEEEARSGRATGGRHPGHDRERRYPDVVRM